LFKTNAKQHKDSFFTKNINRINTPMSYFLFEGSLRSGQQEILKGEEAHHILNSRRLNTGERLLLQDQKQQRFEVEVLNISKNKFHFQVCEEVILPEVSSLKLELLQAFPKEKALHFILQKGTELGVSRILLFGSQYSPKLPRPQQQESRLERWKRITWEACKQSGRVSPPEILLFPDFASLLQSLDPCTHQWMFLPQHKITSEAPSFSEIPLPQHHRILIGAEGGLSCDEEALARSTGMFEMQLGNNVLRTETAAIAAITLFQFLYGNFTRVHKEFVS